MEVVMPLPWLRCLFALLSMVWSASVGFAQEVPSTRGVALVVGNGAYSKVEPLPNPVNDAADMGQVLKDLGWDVRVVPNATLKTMKQALREFGSQLKGQKAGLFYYAGHGIQVDNVNYLVPVDADIGTRAEVPDVTITTDLVMRILEESRVPLKIVVLDACRNNPFVKTRGLSVEAADQGLSGAQTTPTGTILVYATGPNAKSQDGTGRNGVFTEAFVANLRVPGVDFQEIFAKTAQAVVAKTGGQQNPYKTESYYGKLYFISPSEAQKQADARLGRLKAEQDKLAAEIATREGALLAAKTQAEKEKLEASQKAAQAKAAAQKEEQAALERTKVLAEARAAEEAKNKDASALRAQEAEAQLAALRQQVEAQRRTSDLAGKGDDPVALIAQVAALNASIAEVQKQFDESLARRVAETSQAYQRRAALIGGYTMEPWESDSEFAERKAQAAGLASRDQDSEVAGLKASFAQAAALQSSELVKQRDGIQKTLVGREWPFGGGTLSLTLGNFDRVAKTWPLTVTGTKPVWTQNLVYQLAHGTADELRNAYTAFDNASKAGALAPRASFRLTQPYAGFFLAIVSRLEVVDVTKIDPKTKAPLVVVTGTPGASLGWMGAAPPPAMVSMAVPRNAVVWAGETKLAEVKVGQRFEWSTTAYGPATLMARYAEGDVEALVVTLAPGKASVEFSRPRPVVDLVYLPGGTFTMGDTTGGGNDDEKPPHQVTLGGFQMGRTEVTQAQWTKVMGTNPVRGDFVGTDKPVIGVTWNDAVAFCNQLSLLEGLSPAYSIDAAKTPYDRTRVTWNRRATGYRLPTEAEWEFAAKGGQAVSASPWSGSDTASDVAWIGDNWIHPVGQKKPNQAGLYDLSGNVWEWCWDRYWDYPSTPQADPPGPSSGDYRVLRGGSSSYGNKAFDARVSRRGYNGQPAHETWIGFRVVAPVVLGSR